MTATDSRILEFIRNQLNAGYTEYEIRQALINSGWSGPDVDVAFSEILSPGRRIPDRPLQEYVHEPAQESVHESPEEHERIERPERPETPMVGGPLRISKVSLISLGRITCIVSILVGIVVSIAGVGLSFFAPDNAIARMISPQSILKAFGFVSVEYLGPYSALLVPPLFGGIGLFAGVIVGIFFNLAARGTGGLRVEAQ